MHTPIGDTPKLELALLRHGVGQRTTEGDRCQTCERTPLIGERVYVYGSGTILCHLCRRHVQHSPVSSRLVHSPSFGHTIRLIERPAA